MARVTVKLYGYLKKYGKEYSLDVDSPREAVRALSCQLPGFMDRVRAGEFRVIRGKKRVQNALTEEGLYMSMGGAAELHIVPVANGSKRNGLLKVILGVALIGISFAVAGAVGGWTTGIGSGMLAGLTAKTFLMLGAGMLLNGLGQMLSPTPSVDSNESPDSRPSYLFSGNQNISEEGNIIPVAYGAPWCGSLVLSAGMDVEEVV